MKLAWGTVCCSTGPYEKPESRIVKLTKMVSNFEILKMVTSDIARLLAMSGARNPYPGKLGVVEEGALADLLLVEGNPLQNVDLLGDPGNNFSVIIKNGVVYKNKLQDGPASGNR